MAIPRRLDSLPLRSAYLDALARGVLVYDGAMGTSIQGYHLTPADFGGTSLEGCNDHLVLTRPDVIQAIHESFLAVGCDVVETCTFQSTPRRLEEWGIGEKVEAVNVSAARLARAACDRYATSERPRFVAGSIGPTGMLPSSSDPVLSKVTFEELAWNYREQARALIAGGVDVLLVETAQDILEVKAAVAGFGALFRELGFRVPVQAQVTLDTSGRMLLGTDVASAMTTLEALPVDVIGLNCSTGPEHMREPVRYLSQHATRWLSVIPNAGLPLNTGTGDAVYPLEPGPMAAMLGAVPLAMGGGTARGDDGIIEINGIKLMARVLKGISPNDLKGVVDEGKAKLGSGVVALVGLNDEGRAGLIVGVTGDLTSRFNAVDLVRVGSAVLGGKGGGGRPDMAQAGGPDASKAEDALAAIKAAIGG